MKDELSQFTAEYADKQTTTISLEMPAELVEHVKELATLEKVEYQEIINYFVHQGLIDNRAEFKRLQFAENAKTILEKHGTHQNVIDEISNMFLY